MLATELLAVLACDEIVMARRKGIGTPTASGIRTTNGQRRRRDADKHEHLAHCGRERRVLPQQQGALSWSRIEIQGQDTWAGAGGGGWRGSAPPRSYKRRRITASDGDRKRYLRRGLPARGLREAPVLESASIKERGRGALFDAWSGEMFHDVGGGPWLAKFT